MTVRGAAIADSAWTLDGFQTAVNGVVKEAFFNAYALENRQYDGYDTSLKTAYNFGFAIHDDNAAGRFHQVSLGYKLGIDADGHVKAVKQ